MSAAAPHRFSRKLLLSPCSAATCVALSLQVADWPSTFLHTSPGLQCVANTAHCLPGGLTLWTAGCGESCCCGPILACRPISLQREPQAWLTNTARQPASTNNSAHVRLSCTCLQTGPTQTVAEELGFDAEDPDPRNIVMFQLPERLPVPAPRHQTLEAPPPACRCGQMLESPCLPSSRTFPLARWMISAFKRHDPGQCVLQPCWGRGLHGQLHSAPPFHCVGAA